MRSDSRSENVLQRASIGLLRHAISNVTFVSLCAALLFGGCAGFTQPATSGFTVRFPGDRGDAGARTPKLIADDANTQLLEYWPIDSKGGNKAKRLRGSPNLGNASNMAADGHRILVAVAAPAGILVFDTRTKAQQSLPDPYGEPIDVAVGKNGAIYAVNGPFSGPSVIMYPPQSMNPMPLQCNLLAASIAIAVDNEGNVFVNQSGHVLGDAGVIEIPAGPRGPNSAQCRKLRIGAEAGAASGVAIDPTNENLITLNNPGLCAGGENGRVTIYPKPYRKATSQWFDVGNCPGPLRLDATSTVLFLGDGTQSGRASILQVLSDWNAPRHVLWRPPRRFHYDPEHAPELTQPRCFLSTQRTGNISPAAPRANSKKLVAIGARTLSAHSWA